MFCHNCGKKLTEDDVFCNSCGTKTVKPEPEVPSVSEVIPDGEEVIVIGEVHMFSNEATEVSETGDTPDAETDNNTDEKNTEVATPLNLAEMTDEGEETSVDQAVLSGTDESDAIEERPNLLFTEEQPVLVQENDFSRPSDLVFTNSVKKKNQKPPRKGAAKVICVISSVLLSLLMGALLLALIGLVFLRTGFTETRIRSALNSIEYTEYEAKNIFDIAALSEKYEKDIPENATLSEIIYYSIDQNELVNPITKSEVDLLVKRLNFQKFIAERTAKAVEKLRSGSGEQLIHAKDIVDFLRDNQRIIETTIGIPLLEIDFEYMQKHLEDNKDDMLIFLSEARMTEEYGRSGYKFLFFLFSDWFMLILCLLIVGLAVAIGFINRRVRSSLMYTGITFSAAALPLMAFTLIYGIVLKSLLNHSLSNLIIGMSQPVISALTVICAITVAIGMVMIIAGILIKIIIKKTKTQSSYAA